jgi:hypothetical protein
VKAPIGGSHDCPPPPQAVPGVRNLVGLALSGGGIRSATFNLGLLQGLAAQDKLHVFDYLSTVSSGGFAGAWWSAWLSREPHRPPRNFPDPEELEPQRRQDTAVLLDVSGTTHRPPASPDGSLSARRHDPIHFVRLFSNYLTPKTGLMSPDTWRLIAYLVRSLLCTWAALLPLLLAAVIAAQSFYLLNSDSRAAFLCLDTPVVSAQSAGQATFAGAAPTTTFCSREARSQSFEQSRVVRLRRFEGAGVLALGIAATLIIIWLIESASNPGLAALAVVVLSGSMGWMFVSSKTGGSASSLMQVFLVSVAGTVAVYGVRSWARRYRQRHIDGTRVEATASDRRTWLTQKLALVLKIATFTSVLLLTAGFGHDLLWFLFSGSDSATALTLKRAGGWGGLLLTVVSALYTVIKSAPSAERQPSARPSAVGQWLTALAPPLVVFVLFLVLALFAHELLVFTFSAGKPFLGALATAAVSLAVVEVLFAIYESYEESDAPTIDDRFSWRRFVPHVALKIFYLEPTADSRRPWYYLFSPRGWTRIVALGCLITPAWLASDISPAGILQTLRSAPTMAVVVLAAVLLLSFSRVTWSIALKSARPVVLLSGASVTALLCVLANSGISSSFGGATVVLAVLLWIAVLGGSVVALGWLADPNLMSLHGFYKARLARAYLGASNTAREQDQITDAVPGDDLPLKDLWNHDDGAPYHLINSAISLVGGSDLATSQRLAENFIMSRYHCGSARAGYRYTATYMSGELSLATAAAISGAAVSPTMGSKSPSAALALLLSLLNVRLGFWAPTPSGKRAYEPHARLWPFYILSETLSKTGQPGPYCYLTDGGHFDNTALYALVERGCRYIVVSDCGADPDLGFEDIGTAIRRCRIDFGAEIDLKIDTYAKGPDGLGTIHCSVGTIRYQDEHLRMLGLNPATDAIGTILWIKPSVTALSSADVRQYGRAHGDFPQQSTLEQWYDESQFESYRNLGFESAQAAFNPPGLPIPLPPIVAGNFTSIETWFEARAGRR